jgi:hypothetical protein
VAGLRATTWAYVLALIVALPIADDLLRIPIQVSDALEEILAASRSTSLLQTFMEQLSNGNYLRPLRIVQIEALFKMAHGHYWLVYRGFHAVLLVTALLLFTRALRVRTRADLLAAAFAFMVATGVHTFASLIQEAFPINHFLEIVVFALAALNLAQSRGSAWVDVGSLMLFAVAALTLESGLLVWVVAVAARVVGLRGVSRWALVAMTGLLVGYLGWRSAIVGMPTLIERQSGYLFESLEPEELIARFGDRLWWLRSYNVLAATLSVLFSEPRGGVFGLTRSILDGRMQVERDIATCCATLTTMLIGGCGIRLLLTHGSSLRDRWLALRRDADFQLLAVFAAVLGASAAMSYVYVKDDIMSTAGTFYALAAYAAVRWWQSDSEVSQPQTGRPARSLLARGSLVAVLVVAATGWSIASLGIHHVARTAAFKTRNDWAVQPARWKEEGRWPTDAASLRLLTQLRTDAVNMPVAPPRLMPDWMERVWER